MKTPGLAVALSWLAAFFLAGAAAAQNVSGPPVATAPSLPGAAGAGAAAPAMPGASMAAPAGGMMAPGAAAPGAAGLPSGTATPAMPIAPAMPTTPGATAGITGIGGVISSSGGRIYQTKKVGDPTQGFVTLKNESGTADELLQSACPIADSTALVDAQGHPAGKLKLDPGKKLVLSPTGPHLTMKGTHFQILTGSIVPCTLTFKNAGQIQVMLGWELPPAPKG